MINDYINKYEAKTKKLLDSVSDAIHLLIYSDKTEQAYLNWIKYNLIG